MNEPRDEPWPLRACAIAMAALAAAAMDQALLSPGESRAWALVGSVGLRAVPTLVAAWFLGARRASACRRVQGTAGPRLEPRAIALLSALFAWPMVLESVGWLSNGRCATTEVVTLASLRNLGLGLAALAHFPVAGRLSVIVSLFLVTFVSSVGGEGGLAVLAPIGAAAIAGILWLMLLHWQSVHPGNDPGRRVPLPTAAAAWALCLVSLLTLLALAGPSRTATVLASLVPSSGGSDANAPEATSGVGDGDNEVSASKDPHSIGFTESEIYLETDRPSLYDAFNESYGEPFKPRTHEKMIAMGPQDVREQKERPAENLQAGREFPTLRQPGGGRPRRPEERPARALLYVKGLTPLHLPLTTYRRFDGVAWHEEPWFNQALPAEVEPGSGWHRLTRLSTPYLAGTVSHEIKVGTLRTSTLPAPSHLTRFRVGSVNRSDFFGWAQYGLVRMTDRTIPAGTVINSEARTVDPEALRTHWTSPVESGRGALDPSTGRDGAVDPAVRDLAESWIRGVRPGWAQVEAIVAAIRGGHVHDRDCAASPESKDVVADFLLRSRRGPDYLFASSAAVALRAVGYTTRLVSGLYASPEAYDPRTRHVPVTAQDVHFWVEVRLPTGLWIAMEPTPGYEMMPPVRHWTESFAQALLALGGWARRNAAGLSLLGLAAVVLRLTRRLILDRFWTLVFWFAPAASPRRRVAAAVRLLDRRARWAGRPRPPWMTLRRWYRPADLGNVGESRSALEGLVRLAEWAAHAPAGPGIPEPSASIEVDHACRAAVRIWTTRRIRRAIPSA